MAYRAPRIVAALMIPALLTAAASAPAASDAETLKSIRSTLQKLGGRLKDLDTTAALEFTPPSGSADARNSRRIQMTAHLTIKMPDKVKFRVLQSNMPLFNRWIFVQKGVSLAAYDPVSDRRISTDFKKLTGHDPARVDTSLSMLGLMFDPSRYSFTMLGKTTWRGAPVYRVRMRHLKPKDADPLMLISYTDLYVDVKRLLPIYSASYDVRGHLATTTEFRNAANTSIGPAPTRITITDHEFDRLRKSGKLDRARKKLGKGLGVDSRADPGDIFGHQSASAPGAFRNGTLDIWLTVGNSVLVPRTMIATTPHGAVSRWTFTNMKVNTGIKDSAFAL